MVDERAGAGGIFQERIWDIGRKEGGRRGRGGGVTNQFSI